MQALQDSGADMIELGMPYSDPLADGPVIQGQQRMKLAIDNGHDHPRAVRPAERLPEGHPGHRQSVLMGYLNPVMQYGFERFCADAGAVGMDGLILPDLPMHEFETVCTHPSSVITVCT